ncbi:hypothetical protein B0J12DRAFT_585741, partial [Macrophomina phaseolina]
VQWEKVALFLNTLAKLETITSSIKSPEFLYGGDEDFRPLPEDYIIRGQLWAYSYYLVLWFSLVVDEEERILELVSTVRLRTKRILWLGVRLGLVSDFLLSISSPRKADLTLSRAILVYAMIALVKYGTLLDPTDRHELIRLDKLVGIADVAAKE